MCFLIGAVHLHSTKLLWNMYLADFLKIYTLFIIMIFFFTFFWLKGCYKKYTADLRAIGRLFYQRAFFNQTKNKQFIWYWPWSLGSISLNLESFYCQGLTSKLHQTKVIGSFTDTLKEFISGRRQSILCSNVPVVRVLDFQSKIWNLKPLGGFKVDSAFYAFEVRVVVQQGQS